MNKFILGIEVISLIVCSINVIYIYFKSNDNNDSNKIDIREHLKLKKKYSLICLLLITIIVLNRISNF